MVSKITFVQLSESHKQVRNVAHCENFTKLYHKLRIKEWREDLIRPGSWKPNEKRNFNVYQAADSIKYPINQLEPSLFQSCRNGTNGNEGTNIMIIWLYRTNQVQISRSRDTDQTITLNLRTSTFLHRTPRIEISSKNCVKENGKFKVIFARNDVVYSKPPKLYWSILNHKPNP